MGNVGLLFEVRPWLRMEPYDLPMDVSKMITKLTSALDLVYGAIDMIVTPEGEHVFWR